MIARLLTTASFLCIAFALAAAAEKVALPPYEVVVTLSDKAKAKLADSKEMVHISAMYYGEAEEGFTGDEMGEIQFGVEETDIPGEGSVKFGKLEISKDDVAQVVGGKPNVLINVYTSRKVFE